MGPIFDRWLMQLGDFQRRRGAGEVAHPWHELEELASRVDSLAIEGLDSRAEAACLIGLEQGALHYEERDFDKTMEIASSISPTIPLWGPVAELFHSNRELLIGNVFLIRDENAAAAAPHFQAAIDASGPTTPLIAGNAAINLGICQSVLGQPKDALRSYELACEKYELAGRRDKIAVALHSTGNAYRTLGQISDGIEFLRKAVQIYRDEQNCMGLWVTEDDLSRAFLTLADLHPDEAERWVAFASVASDEASRAGTSVWQTLQSEEGRLADLSDQMINHTVTRCELAGLNGSSFDLLGTLALMKGRIRLSRTPIPQSFLDAQPDDLREEVQAAHPWAYFGIVANALDSLRQGRTIRASRSICHWRKRIDHGIRHSLSRRKAARRGGRWPTRATTI